MSAAAPSGNGVVHFQAMSKEEDSKIRDTTPLLTSQQQAAVYGVFATKSPAQATLSFSASPSPTIATLDQLQASIAQAQKKAASISDNKDGIQKGTLQLPKATYEGEIKNGKPHGKGKVTYSKDDDRKRKEFVCDHFIDGVGQYFGKMLYQNGDFYEGEVRDYKFTGIGRWEYNDGAYIGNVLDGKYHGSGIEIINKGQYAGQRYEGNFENGFRSGFGIMYFPDGNRYIGFFKEGKRSGFGKFYWASGDRYEGNWDNGLRDGQGVMFHFDGARFTGQWKNDEKHGWGEYYFSNGASEKGNYVNGLAEGQHDYRNPFTGFAITKNYNKGKPPECCNIL